MGAVLSKPTSLLYRPLSLLLTFVYPAYRCFKVLELRKGRRGRARAGLLLEDAGEGEESDDGDSGGASDGEGALRLLELDERGRGAWAAEARDWLIFWTAVAFFRLLEAVGDVFLQDVMPLYYVLKIAAVLYLTNPSTRGMRWVYLHVMRPFLLQHEKAIDSSSRRMSRVVSKASIQASEWAQAQLAEQAQHVRSRSEAFISKIKAEVMDEWNASDPGDDGTSGEDENEDEDGNENENAQAEGRGGFFGFNLLPWKADG